MVVNAGQSQQTRFGTDVDHTDAGAGVAGEVDTVEGPPNGQRLVSAGYETGQLSVRSRKNLLVELEGVDRWQYCRLPPINIIIMQDNDQSAINYS